MSSLTEPHQKQPRINFSHNYTKLENDVLSTIRRYDKYPNPGELIWIHSPSGFTLAQILWKHKVKLSEIPTPMLTYDTDTSTRVEAIALFNSFYRNPVTPDEKLTVVWLKKVRV